VVTLQLSKHTVLNIYEFHVIKVDHSTSVHSTVNGGSGNLQGYTQSGWGYDD